MSLSIVAKLLVFFLTASYAVETSAEKFPFSLSTNKCPDFLKMAKGPWNPAEIIDHKERQTKCEILKNEIVINDKMTLVFINYLYYFKEADDYTTREQYNFLVDQSNAVVVWKSNIPDYPTGALESVHLLKANGLDVLEFQFFTGGTAGYWEEYYTFHEGQFIKLTESYSESIKPHIPKGYHVRRNRIDLEKGTGIIYLASENDANCCPSAKLIVNITIQKNDITLKDWKYIYDPE
jgi:hypothetical protein